MYTQEKIKQDEPHYLIIPAAGLGTRMRIVNPHMPKEMLPVGHKPAIQYAVEEGLSADIKNIIIIINKQKEIIRQYFEVRDIVKKLFSKAVNEVDKINRECTITFLYQKQALGESDAIGLAKDIVGNHPIAIIHPDDIYFPAPGVLKVLKLAYRQYKKDVIALIKIKEENAAGLSNSGRVDIKPIRDFIFRIEKFHQKGKGQFVQRFKGELRSCGMSISGYHIFEYIQRLRDTIQEGEFTDFPVHVLMLQEKGFLGCCLPGTFFDIGNPKGYEQCLAYIRRNRPLN